MSPKRSELLRKLKGDTDALRNARLANEATQKTSPRNLHLSISIRALYHVVRCRRGPPHHRVRVNGRPFRSGYRAVRRKVRNVASTSASRYWHRFAYKGGRRYIPEDQ